MTSGSLARNVGSNWVVLAANIVYAILLTPLIVRALGTERYGVWSFLNGLLAYSDLLYLGLGSALVKYAAQLRASDDQLGINRLASVVATIYGSLGFVCLVVLSLLSPFAPGLFAEPLSPSIARVTSITCVLLGLRLQLIFLTSAFAGLVNGHDRFDVVNAVQLFGVLVRLALTPPLLTRGWDPLLTLAWITMAGAALDATILPLIAFRLLPRLSIRPAMPTLPELRWLYAFGLQSFFIVFAVKLISYTDTTVIALTLGATSVAAYSLPLQLVEYSRMVIGGFGAVFLPQLAILRARGQDEGMRNTLISTSRIAFFISAWTSSSLIVLGPEFLDRWLGSTVGSDGRYVILFLALASWLHVLITQIPLPFFQALHSMVRPAIILILEALANIVLSLILAPRLGITGVALATLLPVMFISFLTLPPYLCRQLHLPFRSFVVQSLPAGAVLFGLNLIMQLALQRLLPTHSYSGLAVRVALSLPLVAMVFWITFPVSERARIVAVAGRLIPAQSEAR